MKMCRRDPEQSRRELQQKTRKIISRSESASIALKQSIFLRLAEAVHTLFSLSSVTTKKGSSK